MKTLHKYLARQVLASLLLTVAVFTFVVLLGNVLQQVLKLLVEGQIGFGVMIHAVGVLIPFAFVYSLPMGLLTATLLAFGRFSADQELTAARASGISLISLTTPILFLSLCCCALSAWINMDLGPRARAQYVNLIAEAGGQLADLQLPAGRLIYDFPGYIFYTAKNDNGALKDVLVYNIAQNTTLQAPGGQTELDKTNRVLTIKLFNAQSVTRLTNGTPIFSSFGTMPIAVNLNAKSSANGKPKISDMTFSQLQVELREREKLLDFLPASTNSATQWRAQIKETQGIIQKVRSQMHEQIAFSFACFGFALVGIPLGIRVHRRETNIGILMGLALVMIYYTFDIVGMSLSSRPEFFPHLIFWLPNFIFQAVGAVLLWRANKGI
ncbi:MAG TPA: LptF/LptG family permease [Verrucomicrobiae bacterium]